MRVIDIYTLITGASHGIGKAFCHELAKKGHNLFIIALPDKLLQTVENEIKESYDVRVISFGVDSGVRTSLLSLYATLEKLNTALHSVVTSKLFNALFCCGRHRRFCD